MFLSPYKILRCIYENLFSFKKLTLNFLVIMVLNSVFIGFTYKAYGVTCPLRQIENTALEHRKIYILKNNIYVYKIVSRREII